MFEKARNDDRVEKDPAPVEKVPEPQLELGLNRCPFCHADVALDARDWVSCRQCPARHHAACWTESKGCASCRGQEFMTTPTPPTSPPRWRYVLGAFLVVL